MKFKVLLSGPSKVAREQSKREALYSLLAHPSTGQSQGRKLTHPFEDVDAHHLANRLHAFVLPVIVSLRSRAPVHSPATNLRPGTVGNLEGLLGDVDEAGPLHPSSDLPSDVQRTARLVGGLDSQLPSDGGLCPDVAGCREWSRCRSKASPRRSRTNRQE